MVKENKIKCPKCKGETWKFGLDPSTKKQKYRCKNLQCCGYQFIPEKPKRPKKYPSFICPKCGSNMTIFKHLSDGYRLRCNRHNAKGNKKCSHKVNVPFPGKSFKIAKDPIEAINVDGLAITLLLQQDEILKGYCSNSCFSGCNLCHTFADYGAYNQATV